MKVGINSFSFQFKKNWLCCTLVIMHHVRAKNQLSLNLTTAIIRSKYFRNSDWLKAHA